MRAMIRRTWARTARRSAPQFGRAFIIGSAIVIVVLVAQALVGVGRVGISNDEPGHVSRTNSWLRSRWYVPEIWLDQNDDVIATVPTTKLHTYGGAFSLTAHAVGVVTGVEPLDHASTSSSAYAARRRLVVGLGVVGAAAVAYATVLLTRRRSIAVWAGAATLAMPLWTGYSMFAVKDVPTGAGWTMVTAACIAALAPGLRRRRLVMVCGLSVAGVWFSVGTRIALWLPIFGTILIAIVLAQLSRNETQRRHATLALGVGALASAVAVGAVHPRNAATPITWLWNAAVRSADFNEGDRLTLTAGHRLATKPPWWYLPAWFSASIPLLLGALALVGVAFLVVALVRGRAHLRERVGEPDVLMLFWLLQVAALPVFAVIMRSTLYAGLRHHVYVMPAIAALAGYAVHRITSVSHAQGRYANDTQRALVGVVAILALALPMVDQLRLTPYAFVYKNILAGPVDDRWETDMHWVSSREALWRLPVGTRVLCYKDPTIGHVQQPVISDCTRHPQIEPFLDEMGRDAVTDDIGTDVWVIARRSNASPPLAGCRSVADVTRPLRGQEVAISYVLRCDPTIVSVPPVAG
jgi:hypothetical protein